MPLLLVPQRLRAAFHFHPWAVASLRLPEPLLVSSPGRGQCRCPGTQLRCAPFVKVEVRGRGGWSCPRPVSRRAGWALDQMKPHFPSRPSQPGAWAASWFQASRLGPGNHGNGAPVSCWKLESLFRGPRVRLRLDREALWSLGGGLPAGVCEGRGGSQLCLELLETGRPRGPNCVEGIRVRGPTGPSQAL